ncbi:hypothetical protein F5Y11DRAFT_322464 [Daldinia sp. FL1419]|nr:hypothetical protein F5Y11DRAFT_322464 [Daldinia sp. FL1419]
MYPKYLPASYNRLFVYYICVSDCVSTYCVHTLYACVLPIHIASYIHLHACSVFLLVQTELCFVCRKEPSGTLVSGNWLPVRGIDQLNNL